MIHESRHNKMLPQAEEMYAEAVRMRKIYEDALVTMQEAKANFKNAEAAFLGFCRSNQLPPYGKTN